MDKRFNTRLSSLLGSNDFLNDYATELYALLPMIAPMHAQLRDLIDHIFEQAATADADYSGYRIDKDNSRQALRQQVLPVCQAMYIYYWQHQMVAEQGFYHWTEPSIRALDDAKLYVHGRRTAKEAAPLQSQLLNVSSAQITALAASAEHFSQRINSPKYIRRDSKHARAQAKKLVAQALSLRQDIDIFLRTLQPSHPTRYAEWKIGLRIGKYV